MIQKRGQSNPKYIISFKKP